MGIAELEPRQYSRQYKIYYEKYSIANYFVIKLQCLEQSSDTVEEYNHGLQNVCFIVALEECEEATISRSDKELSHHNQEIVVLK
jgi:hypothetical protein